MTSNAITLHGPTGTDTTRLPQEFNDAPEGRQALRSWLRQWGRTLLHVDVEAGLAYHGTTMPGARTSRLADGFRAGDTPRLRAHLRASGQAIGHLDLGEGTVTAISPTHTHMRVRDAIAERLRCEPHDIHLAVAEDAGGRPVHICVERYPRPSRDDAGLKLLWLEVARDLIGPGASSYAHPGSGLVELHWGEPIAFPTTLRVDPARYLSERADQQWMIPLGVDGRGREVAWKLTQAPHALVAGLTGSGKTITLFAIACGALARGFDLAVVEISKSGTDFDDLRPFVRDGWWGCDSKNAASTVIQKIYALKDERMSAIRAAGHKKLHSMSPEEQAQHGLRPVLLLIDEGAALLAAPPPLKGLPKDHPVAIANQQEQMDVALGGDAIRRISGELRAVGIHLVFATQVFEAELLKPAGGGVLRANLPFRVLMGRASTTQIAQAVMRPQAATAAYEAAHGQAAAEDDAAPELDGQPQPGRGIVETDSAAGGFQCVFAPEHEWVAALDALGVPRPGGAAPATETTTTAFPTD